MRLISILLAALLFSAVCFAETKFYVPHAFYGVPAGARVTITVEGPGGFTVDGSTIPTSSYQYEMVVSTYATMGAYSIPTSGANIYSIMHGELLPK